MNYPQLCPKCNGKLFGLVSYCPYCGQVSPLIEQQVNVAEVVSHLVEDSPPQAPGPTIAASDSGPVYQTEEPVHDSTEDTSKPVEVTVLQAETVIVESQVCKIEEPPHVAKNKEGDTPTNRNQPAKRPVSDGLTSPLKERKILASPTIGSAFQVGHSTGKGETADTSPVDVSIHKQGTQSIPTLFKSNNHQVPPAESPLNSDEPTTKESNSSLRSKLKSSAKISDCFINKADKAKEDKEKD